MQQGTEGANSSEHLNDDIETAIDHLATLESLDYDSKRKAEAKRLGIRVSQLDQAVAERRQPLVDDKNSAENPFPLTEFEPAKVPVNGAQLMSDLITFIERHLILPVFGALVIALWVIRAHAHEAFDVNPRLVFLSPDKRCGKTTALLLIAGFVPRSLLVSNATAASIYRLIQAICPTLIFDEFDTFGDIQPEMRGILNSGHRREVAYVLRCHGDDHKPTTFSTWCPMVIAAIGQLTSTLQDRSIVIRMRRRMQSESVQPLRTTGHTGEALRQEFNLLGGRIARWVADHADALRKSSPTVPDTLNDRAADNWASLLAIADELGGEWPAKVRQAAISFAHAYDPDDESFGVQLLHDLQGILGRTSDNKLSSERLCTELGKVEESPWATWNHGRPLTPANLARLLRPFDIHSEDIWVNGKSKKGYAWDSFREAFDRYLPSPERPSEPVVERETAREHSRQPKPLIHPRALAAQTAREGRAQQIEPARLQALQVMWRRAKAQREPHPND